MAKQKANANVEIWVTNEPGTRATFVLAAVRNSTPFSTLPSRINPSVRFLRLPKAAIERLAEDAPTMTLPDDHAPISRLIGVE